MNQLQKLKEMHTDSDSLIAALPVFMSHIEQRGNEIERQEHGEKQSADHTDPAAGTDLETDAPTECHRQHADHARDRGHEDRAEFVFRGLKYRIMQFHSRFAQNRGLVHDQDRVVDHDPDHHNRPQHAGCRRRSDRLH